MRRQRIMVWCMRVALTLLVWLLLLPLPFPKATKYQIGYNRFLIDEIWGIRHNPKEWDRLVEWSGMRRL